MSSSMITSVVATATPQVATYIGNGVTETHTGFWPHPTGPPPRGNPNPPGYSGGGIDELQPLSNAELAADRGYMVTISVAMLIVFSAIFFAGRLASRYMTRVRLRPSDWILLAGIIASYAMGGCYIWSQQAGAGKHLLTIVREQGREVAEKGVPFKAMFVASNFYFAAIVLVKLSILAFFYEIFGTSIPFRTAIWVLVTLVMAWEIGFTVLNFNLCNPISQVWDLSPTNSHNCISGPHYLINGVSNVITDFLILCLPIRAVWYMKLPSRAKIGLSIVFLLGSFVIIASAFRLGYTMIVPNLDPPYDVVIIELWSNVELTVAICCACLLTMRPLLKFVVPKALVSAISGRSRSSRRRTTGDLHGPSGLSGGKNTAQGDMALATFGSGKDGIRTKVTARGTGAYDTLVDGTLVDEESLEEKGTGRIRVTQEGPLFTVETRHVSGGDGSSTDGDLEAGRGGAGSVSTSTKELVKGSS